MKKPRHGPFWLSRFDLIPAQSIPAWATMIGQRISMIPEPLSRKTYQMGAVAIWNVSEDPERAHLWSLKGAQNSRLLTPPPADPRATARCADRHRRTRDRCGLYHSDAPRPRHLWFRTLQLDCSAS